MNAPVIDSHGLIRGALQDSFTQGYLLALQQIEEMLRATGAQGYQRAIREQREVAATFIAQLATDNARRSAS